MSGVWVPVLASMRGFVSEVNKGAGQAAKSASSAIKKDLTDAGREGGKSSADAMAAEFGKASTKVAAARKKEAGAASELRVAEEQLEQVRSKGDASAGDIMAAEAKVSDARRRQEAAADRLGAAETDLQSVRDGGEARVTAVTTAETSLEDARLKAQAATEGVSVAEQQAADARGRAESAAAAAETAEVQLALAKAENDEGSKLVAQAERELEKARRDADKASVAAEKAEGQVSRARADSATAAESAEGAELKLAAAKDTAARSAEAAGRESSNAANETRMMGEEMASADPKAGGLSDSLMGLAGKATLTAGAFVGIRGIGDMISSGFDKVTSIEDTTASLSILMGSAEEAAGTMDLLTESNMKTPYSFDAWSEAGKNLIAFGFDADKANDSMIALGEAASASGKGEQALSSMADAFGKAAAQGRIGGDLIQSLSTGGVDALAILGNSFGVATDEMQKMISAGTVPVEEAFDALTDGIVNGSDGVNGSTMAMGGVMEEMSQTTSGQLGLLKMSFVNMAGDIMEMLLPAIQKIADVGSNVIGYVRDFIAAAKDKKGWLIALGVAVGAFAAGLAAVQIASFVSGLMLAARGYLAMYRAVGLARSAQILFNGAVLANPLVWVVAAIVAVVAALVLFFTKTELGRDIWSKFTDFLGAAWERIKGFFVSAWETIEPIWDAISNGAQVTWDAIKDFATGVGEAWDDFTSLLSDKYEQYIEPMLDAFRTKFEEARDIISPFIDDIKEKWETFSTAVQSFYEEHIAPAVEGFKEKFGELIEKVREFVQEYWEPYLKPALMILAALLLGPVLVGIMVVVGAVAAFIAIIAGLIYIVVSLPGWIAGAVEGVKEWFLDMKDNVVTWFREMGESITGWWTDHVAVLPGKIGEAVEGVKDWFRDLWDSVKTWFREMGETVSNWWTDHVEPLPGQIGEAVTGMLSKLGELPGKIGDLFADAGQWLVSAGQRILNGLWEGMKQKWVDLKGWLSNTFSFNNLGSLIGFSSGGVTAYADGGISAYAAGGIDQLEAYANGGSRENHVAQIAPAGAWRVWAEPETGGEGYVPLHPSKRARSTAITAEIAGRFGYTLVDSTTGEPYGGGYSGDLGPQQVMQFADGAVVGADDFTSFVHGGNVGGQQASGSLEGWTYQNYPSDPGAWGDCSYTVGKVAALAVGRNTPGRHFATGTQDSALSSWGFFRGRGDEGDLRIGFKNGGPGGGHTSGTLPDGTNFEMGGGRGNGQIGGPAAGAWDSYYTDFFYLPVAPTFENVELDDLGDLAAFDDPYAAGYSPVTEAESITAGADPMSTSQPDTISGRVGSIAEEMVSGQVEDFLSVWGIPDTVPSWMTGAEDVYNAATSPRTSVAEDHAEALHNDAVTSMTADEIAADPQLSGMDSMDVTVQPEVPDWGPAFFAHQIAQQAVDMGLDADAAKIGIATALVESGDPMQMYANNAVPESLQFRHDAVGSDHHSVGLFQQRNNGAWGTTEQRMDPYESAGMFFRELITFAWQDMDPGAAAQRVQRSAFPDRYGQKMSRAAEMVADTGLFGDPVAEAEAITAQAAVDLGADTALYDQGGVLDHEKLALNLSGKPEAVLTNDQWQMLSGLGESLPDMVGSAASSVVGGAVTAGTGAAAGMADMVMPGAGSTVSGLAGPAGDMAGWYAGQVASGWTSALVTAGQQAASIVREPFEDLQSQFAGPVGPVVEQVRASFGEMPERGGQGSDVESGPGRGRVTIIVQSVEQALEAKKHEEARQLAGFIR